MCEISGGSAGSDGGDDEHDKDDGLIIPHFPIRMCSGNSSRNPFGNYEEFLRVCEAATHDLNKGLGVIESDHRQEVQQSSWHRK